jgi:GT2 family glycosyltransferase
MTSIQPYFSIVIPTYNRPKQLKNCLGAIAQINYPHDRFEVIVVDDGSETALDEVVAPFQAHLNLTLIRQANAGPATARNQGAMRAQGTYLVFTDDDCTPLPNWLQALEAQFVDASECLVGGHTLNALPENLFSTTSQMLIDYLYVYYNADPKQAYFFASNNFALPADVFQQIGNFDTSFPLAAGEDREFCDRILHRGYRLRYAPDAQIYHAHHLTLHSFWRQHFNYGRGAFHFHQIRSQRNSEKIKVEPFAFYWNLLTYPFSQPSEQIRVFISILFLVSQVANVAGFFWEQRKQQPKTVSTNALSTKKLEPSKEQASL